MEFSEVTDGGVKRGNWLSSGCIHAVANIPGGLTKATSSDSLGVLLNKSSFRIVTEIEKGGIIRKIPASKRYIVYPEAIRGRGDLDTDARRMARAGWCTSGNRYRRLAIS